MTAAPALPTDPIDVLLVDGNPLDAGLTMRALAKVNLDSRLRWVWDGAEAIDLIFGSAADPAEPILQSPRLVLLELTLPRVGGHDVLRRLKSDARTRHIPVVIVTSSRDNADLERAYDNGANGFVVKPAAFDAYVAAVTEIGLYWFFLNRSVDAGSRRDSAPATEGEGVPATGSSRLDALIVGTPGSDCELIVGQLERAGYSVAWQCVDTVDGMRRALMESRWDIVFGDHATPHLTSAAALGVLHASGCDAPFILVTRAIGEEAAAAVMRAGAHDILLKHRLGGLGTAVRRALNEAEERRRRAASDDALRDDGALLHAILDGTPDAIYAKDVVGRYVYANAEMERATGMPAGELRGKDDTALFPAPRAAAEMEHDRAVLASRVPTTYEESLMDAAGRVASYLTTKAPLFDAGGRRVGLLGVARDITAHKQEKERLRIFADLCDLLPVGIFMHDARGRVLYANQRLCDSHGYSRAEVLALTAGELAAPEDAASRRERARVIAERGGASFLAQHRRKDGTLLPLNIFVRTARLDGAEVFVTVAVDISTHDAAGSVAVNPSSQPPQRQQLERIGRLAEAVSNELNTMLADILRTLDMATSILPEENPLSTELDEIHQSGERATAIAQQLAVATREPDIAPDAVRPDRPDFRVSGHIGAA